MIDVDFPHLLQQKIGDLQRASSQVFEAWHITHKPDRVLVWTTECQAAIVYCTAILNVMQALAKNAVTKENT